MIREAKRELDAAMAAPILAAMRRPMKLPPAPKVTIPVEPPSACPHCGREPAPRLKQRKLEFTGFLPDEIEADDDDAEGRDP